MRLFSRPKKRLPPTSLFNHFKEILHTNNQVLAKIARMEESLGGEYVFDRAYLQSSVAELAGLVRRDIYHLNAMTNGGYARLFDRFEEIVERLGKLIDGRPMAEAEQFIMDYADLNRDMDEFVGAKNAHLAEAGNVLGVPIPQGFALTSRAYNFVLEHNAIPEKFAAMAGIELEKKAEHMAELFAPQNMPPLLKKEINAKVKKLGASGETLFAVRSSAVGEDDESGLAGQFDSYLNVPAGEVADRCMQVMASRFTEQILRGPALDANCWELPMAIAVQKMIDTSVGGVIYTRDPAGRDPETLLISAVRGNSDVLVSGEENGDHYFVARHAPFVVQRSMIGVHGPDREELSRALGTREEGMRRGSSLVTARQLRTLAEIAMLLEKHFEQPRDIEWALDPEGRVIILQCRPLAMAEPPHIDPESIRAELAAAPVLIKDCGYPAQLGVAAGEVVHIDTRNPPADFPVGAIAVSPTADPALSDIVRRCAAILTEVGGPTGHLASIAREYRTPALFGCGKLRDALPEGRAVTVDVEDRKIYDGYVKALDMYQRDLSLVDSAEMRVLRRLLRLIVPLNQDDIKGFAVERCQTLHDIIRFCHEKAVSTLADAHTGAIKGGDDKVLNLPLPLRIRLVDLGGGVSATDGMEIVSENIESRPLRAIIQGLLLKGVWENDPVSLGIRDLLASALRTPQLGVGSEVFAGENLGIIAGDYVNLSLRLGYHFNVIDSYISNDPDNNYIYFRFVGGMADKAKRARRAELISRILRGLYFRTEARGDLVIGKNKMLTPEQAQSILGRLGQLVAFTRQLDVRMVNDDAVDRFLEQFIAASRATGESL